MHTRVSTNLEFFEVANEPIVWDMCLLNMQMISAKGQLISKASYQAVNSSKKRTNEFVFPTMRHVFVRFVEEIEDTKKTFRN